MPPEIGLDPAQFGLLATPLEALIGTDAEVRVVAVFVAQLDLAALDFRTVGRDGASTYGPALLLKLNLYGYLNRLRSSRRLQRACEANIEVMCLTGNLRPKYRTIADIRRDHPAALREYVLLLRDWDLIAGQRLPVDGTKVRAQNSRKRNFNATKLQRSLDRIDKGIKRTLQEFAERNAQEHSERKAELQQRGTDTVAALRERSQAYKRQQQVLQDSGQGQLSQTDADARLLGVKWQESVVGYNVQSVVDAEHKLIVHTETTNCNDINALAGLAGAAQAMLEARSMSTPAASVASTKVTGECERATEPAVPSQPPPLSGQGIEVLVDKGYHDATNLAAVDALGMPQRFVVECKQSQRSRTAESGYGLQELTYDEDPDHYRCPQRQQLTTTGKWYQRHGKEKDTGPVKRFCYYRSLAEVCRQCPLYEQCVSAAARKQRGGKVLTRKEHAAAVERNHERLKQRPEIYPQRRALIEHPFDTWKRNWGAGHTLPRGLDKVEREFSLAACSYNLRRSMSILGVSKLLDLLRAGILGENEPIGVLGKLFDRVLALLCAIFLEAYRPGPKVASLARRAA